MNIKTFGMYVYFLCLNFATAGCLAGGVDGLDDIPGVSPVATEGWAEQGRGCTPAGYYMGQYYPASCPGDRR